MIETLPLSAPENHKTWPKGRRCHKPGCTTPLSIHNGTNRCSIHGGWQSRIKRNLDKQRDRETFMAEVKDIMEQP